MRIYACKFSYTHFYHDDHWVESRNNRQFVKKLISASNTKLAMEAIEAKYRVHSFVSIKFLGFLDDLNNG